MEDLAFITLKVVIVLVVVLVTVLLLTYLERKVIGHFQQRLGPMRVGFHGALQAPADALKLLSKEDTIPASADQLIFRMAPYIVFIPGFLVFVTIPFTKELVVRSLDLGLFYVVAVSCLSISGFVLAGWASNNKYALLGGMRSAAQMISYEIPLVMSVLGVAMLANSLNLATIVEMQSPVWYIIVQPLGFFIFMVASLAELNRTPFDIPVAESEVVGGPTVEYSGIRWAIFYLAEYGNIFAIGALGSVLFLGGWQGPVLPGIVWFLIKTYSLILLIFWLRVTLPRMRIDQLMTYCWKFLLPLAFINLLLTGVYLMFSLTIFLVTAVATAIAVYGGYTVYRGRAVR